VLAPSTSKLAEMQETLRANADVIDGQPLPGEVPGSFERFVLAHGRSYRSATLTTKERAIVDAAIAKHRAGHGPFEKRRCFENSQNLMLCDDTQRIGYVEGYAWTHALRPVLHGWLSLGGKVIDVTLPATTRREAKLREPLQILGEFAGRTYLGVPFLKTYVAERILFTGPGSLLDDPQHQYPLLKSGGAKAVRRAR
jgi:hypothetical protein